MRTKNDDPHGAGDVTGEDERFRVRRARGRERSRGPPYLAHRLTLDLAPHLAERWHLREQVERVRELDVGTARVDPYIAMRKSDEGHVIWVPVEGAGPGARIIIDRFSRGPENSSTG